MTAINPTLLREGYKLTASFYEAGIDCPPLVEFNRWIMSQQLAVGQAGAVPAATKPLGNGTADFDTALTAALKTSPNGVDIGDLRAILTPYGKTPPAIGAALGRMAKAGTAEKRGELWFATADGKVDRRLTQGRVRKPRQRRTTGQPGAAAGAEAAGDAQRQAA